MTPREIKVLLVMRDVNLAQVARDLGVNPSLVSAVTRLEKRSLRVEQHVSGLLGVPIEDLFGPMKRSRRGVKGHVTTLTDVPKAS